MAGQRGSHDPAKLPPELSSCGSPPAGIDHSTTYTLHCDTITWTALAPVGP